MYYDHEILLVDFLNNIEMEHSIECLCVHWWIGGGHGGSRHPTIS